MIGKGVTQFTATVGARFSANCAGIHDPLRLPIDRRGRRLRRQFSQRVFKRRRAVIASRFRMSRFCPPREWREWVSVGAGYHRFYPVNRWYGYGRRAIHFIAVSRQSLIREPGNRASARWPAAGHHVRY